MPVWLTNVGHWFERAWTWIKGHWALLLLGVGILAMVVLAKRKSDQYENLLKEFQGQMAQNSKELDELRKIQQDQIAAQAEITRKYREVVSRIEQNYRDQLQNLDANKEKELRAVIAANRNDPDAMAREINSVFGIPIYTLPPQP